MSSVNTGLSSLENGEKSAAPNAENDVGGESLRMHPMDFMGNNGRDRSPLTTAVIEEQETRGGEIGSLDSRRSSKRGSLMLKQLTLVPEGDMCVAYRFTVACIGKDTDRAIHLICNSQAAQHILSESPNARRAGPFAASPKPSALLDKSVTSSGVQQQPQQGQKLEGTASAEKRESISMSSTVKEDGSGRCYVKIKTSRLAPESPMSPMSAKGFNAAMMALRPIQWFACNMPSIPTPIAAKATAFVFFIDLTSSSFDNDMADLNMRGSEALAFAKDRRPERFLVVTYDPEDSEAEDGTPLQDREAKVGAWVHRFRVDLSCVFWKDGMRGDRLYALLEMVGDRLARNFDGSNLSKECLDVDVDGFANDEGPAEDPPGKSKGFLQKICGVTKVLGRLFPSRSRQRLSAPQMTTQTPEIKQSQSTPAMPAKSSRQGRAASSSGDGFFARHGLKLQPVKLGDLLHEHALSQKRQLQQQQGASKKDERKKKSGGEIGGRSRSSSDIESRGVHGDKPRKRPS